MTAAQNPSAPKTRAPWRVTELRELARLYESGLSVHAIAAEFGRTPSAIGSAVARLQRHRPEHARHVRSNSTWVRIRQALEDNPDGLTCIELKKASKVSESSMLRCLHDHHGTLLRIVAWRPSRRRLMAVWALGNGIDAPKPGKSRKKAVVPPVIGWMAAQMQ